MINLVHQHYDSKIKDKNTDMGSNDNAALSAEEGGGRGQGKEKKKSNGKMCSNYGKDGHGQPNCYAKGGLKEGQAP